jgi:acyl-CoA synthetase (AMP-forming)/AMP-acid ligase II
MAAKFGGSLVMEQAFLYPYRIVELLREHKVTGFPLVPTITAILLRMKDLDQHEFPHLRYITNTAQAMPERFVRDMRRIFPEARIYLMYGLTECKRVSYLPPEEIDRRALSVGKAMPNTEVFLEDIEGRRITESGRIGELIVRGGSVMRGYWGLPEETSRVLEPGPVPGERQLRTGDLFKMDDEGYLYFVGRRDDVLKVGGERVSPKEIEDCLYRLDGVAEAAVVGVEDEILGQAVKAVLVLKDGAGLTEQDVLRHCSEQMEAFLVPKFVSFMESLPRTAHGKIDRQALAASR